MRYLYIFSILLFLLSCKEEDPLISAFTWLHPTQVPEGEFIQFENQSSGEGLTYLWTLEGGTPSSSDKENPKVFYHEPGTYSVSLTVAKGGLSDTHLEEDLIEVYAVPLQDKIEAIIQEVRSKYQIKGVGYTLLSPTANLSNVVGTLNSNRQLSSENKWHFASNTKMVTSTILLQMAEEGLISIDDPISEYGISYSNIDNSRTIQELMGQVTDYYSFSDNSSLWNDVYNDVAKVYSMDHILGNYILEPVSNVSSSFQYSNTNHAILGQIIEFIEQKPVSEVAAERIFDPLGLQHTQFSTQGIDVEELNGVWYQFGNTAQDLSNRNVNAWLSIWGASASMTSTTEEMAILVKSLLSTQTLSQTSIDQALTPSKNSGWSKLGFIGGYGKGFLTIEYNGNKMYGHRGTGLHKSFSIYDTTNDISLVVAYNHQGDHDDLKIEELIITMYLTVLDEIS